jgi:hypothetical protein
MRSVAAHETAASLQRFLHAESRWAACLMQLPSFRRKLERDISQSITITPTPNSVSTYLPWANILKGLSIVFVVIGHITPDGFVNELIYIFHMPLFIL